MSYQFSVNATEHLADAVLLNRIVYGGRNALERKYLNDYDAVRDPDDVGDRGDLHVYDRYDLQLKELGFSTLLSKDLGFAPADIGADEASDGLDHNYTYLGGLFRNNYQTNDLGETAFVGAGAVALTTLKPNDTGNTFFLTFRGTDADGPLADGEAGSARGQVRYYEQLRSLIDQVYDYVSNAANAVTEIVVSGHSLGGTVADLFALYDGARFDAIDGVDLSVISLASAGVAPDLLDLMPGYDSSIVHENKNGKISFDTPDWYFQYDHQEDIVRNPKQYDSERHAELDPVQALITGIATGSLKHNIHFSDNRLQFETPSIDQYDVSKDFATVFLSDHYADLYELIGTEFSKAWPLAGEKQFDHFIALFGESDALADLRGKNNVNTWGLPVDDQIEGRKYQGDLFILGLSGDDTIRSGKGADFVSGGAGDDQIRTGKRNDVILGDIEGKTGDDIVRAGRGNDTIIAGGGTDTLFGRAGADHFVFMTGDGVDKVMDFDAVTIAHDLIDLTGLTGIADWADLVANHLSSNGADVLIDAGNGDVLTLRNVQLIDLDESDFLF